MNIFFIVGFLLGVFNFYEAFNGPLIFLRPFNFIVGMLIFLIALLLLKKEI
jgi:hypothetical protein